MKCEIEKLCCLISMFRVYKLLKINMCYQKNAGTLLSTKMVISWQLIQQQVSTWNVNFLTHERTTMLKRCMEKKNQYFVSKDSGIGKLHNKKLH